MGKQAIAMDIYCCYCVSLSVKCVEIRCNCSIRGIKELAAVIVDAVYRFKDERAEMEATIKELQLMVQEQVDQFCSGNMHSIPNQFHGHTCPGRDAWR